MPTLKTKIISTGSYVPPKIVKNSDIAHILNSKDEWIKDKIGIESRRYVEKNETCSDLAFKASLKALERCGLEAKDLDAILFATATPDHFAPGAGVLLQQKLGCRQIPAFDIRNTSPGFLFALDLGDQMIQAGKYETVLVVGSEVHSTALDMSPQGRLMSVIFGDGAGVVILRKSDDDSGIRELKLYSDGTHYDKLWCEAPGSKFSPHVSEDLIKEGRVFPTMDGRFVFENAVNLMSEVCEEVLQNQKLTIQNIDHVIPHQANIRIIQTIGERLNIPLEKVGLTISKYGNTSAASIPITLDEMNDEGKIKSGDQILTMSFGSGLSWAAGVIEW